eukprot:g729.t1
MKLYAPLPTTGVTFNTSDRGLQRLYDHGAAQEARNGEHPFLLRPKFDCIIEGEQYVGAWLETQPMAGAMYAARDVRLAVDNQLVFMRSQRADGRLPHRVDPCSSPHTHDTKCAALHPATVLTLQGLYMASPSVDVAWFMRFAEGNKADAYLRELSGALERYEDYLWATRNDSACFALFNASLNLTNCPATRSPGPANARGVLWAVGTRGGSTGDTGEDSSTKYCRKVPPARGGSPPPSDCDTVPGVLSMDMMGYSHDLRRSLARIASILGDDPATVQNTTFVGPDEDSPDLAAMYDRYADDSFVPTLQHNNLRAMWLGLFTQAQADAFVSVNLMNRSRFWTKMPLPSIAVSDPHFVLGRGNNWSGPPEGLTLQRAIRALESYGHHAESLLVGLALTASLLSTPGCGGNSTAGPGAGTRGPSSSHVTGCAFPQQIDPFTGVPEPGDGYGPMIMSLLEYTARRVGIVPVPSGKDGQIWWSAAYVGDDGDADILTVRRDGRAGATSSTSSKATTSSTATTDYTQRLGGLVFTLRSGRDGHTGATWAHGIGAPAIGCATESLFNVTAVPVVAAAAAWQAAATTAGVRIITNTAGMVTSLVGIANVAQRVTLSQCSFSESSLTITIKPNEEWTIDGDGKAILAKVVPFYAPHD